MCIDDSPANQETSADDEVKWADDEDEQMILFAGVIEDNVRNLEPILSDSPIQKNSFFEW